MKKSAVCSTVSLVHHRHPLPKTKKNTHTCTSLQSHSDPLAPSSYSSFLPSSTIHTCVTQQSVVFA